MCSGKWLYKAIFYLKRSSSISRPCCLVLSAQKSGLLFIETKDIVRAHGIIWEDCKKTDNWLQFFMDSDVLPVCLITFETNKRWRKAFLQRWLTTAFQLKVREAVSYSEHWQVAKSRKRANLYVNRKYVWISLNARLWILYAEKRISARAADVYKEGCGYFSEITRPIKYFKHITY